ncbi:MAG: ketoacyl-ACP synthase III [Vicingaceae bacterium]|nr:ketoacyl-ACP synthase III [Vicingaceae bacterium]
MATSIKYISEFFPEEKYTNDDFFKEFPQLEKQKKSLEKIGVENRHIISKSETSLDLAIKAAKKLFKEHPVQPNDIDFIIFCSLEFEYTLPSTAAVFQDKLGLSKNIGAIDIVSSCTGFIHSLSVAKGLMDTNGHQNILMLFPSSLTKEFHPKDYNSKFIFGDGASAVLLKNEKENSIGQFVFGTDGSRKDYIIIKDGRGRNPINESSYTNNINEYGNVSCNANFFMNGTGVFLFGIKTIPQLINDILTKNNKTHDEIDYFVLHQANEFLLESIRKKSNIPKEKFIIHLKDTGNTVASTIPLALNSLMKKGESLSEKTVLIAAFGTGLTWGGTIVKL